MLLNDVGPIRCSGLADVAGVLFSNDGMNSVGSLLLHLQVNSAIRDESRVLLRGLEGQVALLDGERGHASVGSPSLLESTVSLDNIQDDVRRYDGHGECIYWLEI